VARKALSKSRRFAILKRDYFTCRYCGRTPPEVRLEVDHLLSVKLGGGDDDANLVAACHDCNNGKSALGQSLSEEPGFVYRETLRGFRERFGPDITLRALIEIDSPDDAATGFSQRLLHTCLAIEAGRPEVEYIPRSLAFFDCGVREAWLRQQQSKEGA
jgi:hypothetical protein